MKWQAIGMLYPKVIEHDYGEGTLHVTGGYDWRSLMDKKEYATIHAFDITIIDNYLPFLARLTPNSRVRVIFEYDDEDQEDGGT